MIIRLLIIATLLKTSSVALATPSVSDDTISWKGEELTASINPLVSDSTDVTSFDMIDLSQDMVSTFAGHQLDQLAVVVDDLAFYAEQNTTIHWPDNSWYQVQNPDTLAILCDGGAECQIVPGDFLVVNQTTGTRSKLNVPYINPANQSQANQLPDITVTIDDAFSEPSSVTLKQYSYNCEEGGSMIKQTGAASRTAYLFEQCRISCLLYTSPSPRDRQKSRMPSSA